MLALTVNCGSSTLKCALIQAESGDRLATVQAELRRVGGQQNTAEVSTAAATALEGLALQPGRMPDLVVHRIVHGGDRFPGPVRIDDRTAADLVALEHLAPLHNRLALAVMSQARALLPALPHVAVFDTSFHHTLPPVARTYALQPALCERLGIRRFGFHGLSHANVLRVTERVLGKSGASRCLVSCHLGNGASLAAIRDGASIDTSMGMTPLEGLVMGTRAGDLDPGVLLELMRAPGMDLAALSQLLYEGAGLRALTGTHDMREIERAAVSGDEACLLAMSVYAYRVRKYIGAYAAAMGGLDVLAFTGGVGEHSAAIRASCVEGLSVFGIGLDKARNERLRLSLAEPVIDIAAADSRVRVLVILADEEREMARAAAQLLHGGAMPTQTT